MMAVSGKALTWLCELPAELAAFFLWDTIFILNEWLTNYGYADVGNMADIFSKNEQMPITSRKTADSMCGQW